MHGQRDRAPPPRYLRQHVTIRTLLPLVAASALLLFAVAPTDAAQPAPTKRQATVDHVADGDTIQVAIDGRQEDVRLIGIDTPEVYFGAECGGPQASAAMKRMLKPGDRVRLIRDRSQANRDRYGRLLRYVELAGRDLGRKQIRKGWAEVYVFEDPFNRLDPYRRAAKKARRADRGVWDLCGGF
jgi:endonuclease YncB( thermonuclease family)